MDLSEKYGFVLEWSDLPDFLIDEKVLACIEFDYKNGNLDADAHSLDWYLSDLDTRYDVEHRLARYFPIYF